MDVKEAVAIRRDGVFPDDMGGTERAYRTAEADSVLADAYLAQCREDDGEVVRKGTTRIDGFECDVEADEPLQANWSVAVWSEDGMLGSAEMHKQPTVGMLRALVRGLGGEA